MNSIHKLKTWAKAWPLSHALFLAAVVVILTACWLAVILVNR